MLQPFSQCASDVASRVLTFVSVEASRDVDVLASDDGDSLTLQDGLGNDGSESTQEMRTAIDNYWLFEETNENVRRNTRLRRLGTWSNAYLVRKTHFLFSLYKTNIERYSSAPKQKPQSFEHSSHTRHRNERVVSSSACPKLLTTHEMTSATWFACYLWFHARFHDLSLSRSAVLYYRQACASFAAPRQTWALRVSWSRSWAIDICS